MSEADNALAAHYSACMEKMKAAMVRDDTIASIMVVYTMLWTDAIKDDMPKCKVILHDFLTWISGFAHSNLEKFVSVNSENNTKH